MQFLVSPGAQPTKDVSFYFKAWAIEEADGTGTNHSQPITPVADMDISYMDATAITFCKILVCSQ